MAIMQDWLEFNELYLEAALTPIRNSLARYADPSAPAELAGASQADLAAAEAQSTPPALEVLKRLFQLSPFEERILLLCAGVELDGNLCQLLARVQGANPQQAYPTLALALSLFPERDWRALIPTAPLRRYRLIHIEPRGSLTQSPIRIDERILHYLLGIDRLDVRLRDLAEETTPAPSQLVPSHQYLVERLVALLSQTDAFPPPVIQLWGPEAVGKRAIVAAACQQLDCNWAEMSASTIPTAPGAADAIGQLWTREMLLSRKLLLLDCDSFDAANPQQVEILNRFIRRTPGLRFVTCRERLAVPHRPVICFEVCKPSTSEQRQLWEASLADLDPHLADRFDGQIGQLTTHFNLSSSTIQAVCQETSNVWSPDREADPTEHLWQRCCERGRPRLDELAQRIDSQAIWADLVLPAPQTQVLQSIAAHVRCRAKVYEDWGFGRKGSRGLGISALFAGTSGTGKTLAAEVLARTLKLDLYRIDLSSVISKYIGETEKNLRRVFDAAEDGGAILLFDEADALFGKRGEVKDSHDRYANIEVSYLLQRLECYPGLAILTTNLKSSIDTAFLRRIRFIVQFPFPNAIQRAEIWQRIFPQGTPTSELKPSKLAQLNIAGGNIRNIALNAAFIAADAGEPVRMQHVLHSTRMEYAKLEKNLTDSEIAGWV